MAKPAAACPILVERDRELGLLARVAADVSAGVAQLVVISGESGAGKSRLLTEFVASLDAPWRKTVTSGSASRRPFADVIAGAPVSGERPELEVGAALAASLRPPTGEPSVVVVDDAHELDRMMIRALGIAVDLLDAAPVLILVAFRVGDEVTGTSTTAAVAELLRNPRAIDVHVGPLSRVAVVEMASAFGTVLQVADADDVVRRSGGNAFFIEELLLAPGRGVSWTVTETVLRRVNSAGAAGIRVAELLSVAARPLPAAVFEDLDADGGAGVLALVERGIAFERDDEVSLRHALVGEVVRGHLTAAARKRLHRALAERLETEHEPPAVDITRHWVGAGDRERAAAWAVRAAADAVTGRGYMTASQLYAIALDVPPSDPLEHALLLERAAGAASWAGSTDLALLRAQQADARYREAGESWRAVALWLNPRMRKLPKPVLDVSELDQVDVSALLVASAAASGRGDHEQAAVLARDARALARRGEGDDAWIVEAAYCLARSGELIDGEEILQRILLTSTLSEQWAVARDCAGSLALVALARGDIDRCIEYNHQALELSERIGHATWGLEVALASMYAARGDLDDAKHWADRATVGEGPLVADFAQLALTWVDLERNDVEQAAARIARMAQVRSLGVATYTVAVLYADARRHHRTGDFVTALALLDEADSLCGDLFEPTRSDRLMLRARLAAELDDRVAISAARSQLEEMVVRGGGLSIAAAVEWAAGLWERSSGQDDEAGRRFSRAAEGLERASRFVLAAEAWCDAAEVVDGSRRESALDHAGRICDGRGLVAVGERVRRLVAAGATGEPPVPAAFAALTPRQRDIAMLVAEGRSNREIAERLYLSVNTVRNVLVVIFDILGVARRSEIAALANRT
jgi:DNA-binding CsgD family transcriptional regulator/tetratricopeptide (TPR) repeat protein